MKLFPLLLLILGCSQENFTLSRHVPTDEIKICFIGDTGTGSKIQEMVADRLNSENCDTTHFLGDIIYPKGLSTVNDREFQDKFHHFYKNLVPKYLVMGNHDHRKSIGVWMDLARKYPDIIFPHPNYLLKLNNLCMVHLDSNYYKLFLKFGTGFRQHLWLGGLEDELKSCSKKVVIAHHPYKSSGKHHGDSTGLMKWFYEANVIGKFDALIAGHEHILSDEGTSDGTRLLVSGGGGNPQKGEPAGYLVMFWNETTSEMKFEFRKIPASNL